MMTEEIILIVWGVGTLPATYVAARRSAAWEEQRLSDGMVAPVAIMFWPAWFFGALIIKPMIWPIKALYVRVWKVGERHSTGSGEP